MAISEDIDSGMGSLVASSKDVTPEKPKSLLDSDPDDEDVEDETLAERLYGLTEMFPEKLVRNVEALISNTGKMIKVCYDGSRTLSWVVFSSAVILLTPVVIECDRAQMEEAQRSQQKGVLLGPNAAMSGNSGRGMTIMPSR
ncbi:mitochondrial import receptor subunit TOM22 homolog [Nilaparvata lugens]|uniref:mitochondrial import receptor subunit TOM22 homolog n=1 Tax=Nilaparvata lugens TaxID=108931 RepID=UPI000B98F25C|nr:mitochondrial import receptor subunit TOM22 homolog [Nilaparvata lugens]